MSEKKTITISVAVEEASVQKLKRALSDIITLVERLGKLSGGALGGNAGGILSSMNVGGAKSTASMIASTGSRGPTAGGRVIAAFADEARGIQKLAGVSKDAAQVMADAMKKTVSDQKRSIDELDTALARLSRRYKDWQSQKESVVGGYQASGMSRKEAEAAFEARSSGLQAEVIAKSKARTQLSESMGAASESQKSMEAIASPAQARGLIDRIADKFVAGLSGGARGGVVAGAIAGGVIAGANELRAQNFDYISAKARSNQAMGNMGLATRRGDLGYTAALMELQRDPALAKEFFSVGNDQFTAGTAAVGKGVINGITNLNPNLVGEGLRGVKMLDASMKEELASHLEQIRAADPNLQYHLQKFESEAGQRVSAMRRMGIGASKFGNRSGDKNLSDLFEAAGEDAGAMPGMFEAVRGAGRGFAQKNMFNVLAAYRGGMNPGDIGSLLTAGAAGGQSAGLLGATAGQGYDPVLAESLARGIVSGLKTAAFGPTSGMGLAGVFGAADADAAAAGMSPEMRIYRQQQRENLAPSARLFGGADPMGSAINILQANKVLGHGADIYSINALSELGNDPGTLLDVLAGGQNRGLARRGITNANVKDFFERTTSANFRARFNNGATGLSPASQTWKSMISDYGGNIKAFMAAKGNAGNREDMLTDLSIGLRETMPQSFKTDDEARAAIENVLYSGSGAKKGKRFGDAAFGSSAQSYARTTAQNQEKDFGEFVHSQEGFIKEMVAMQKVVTDKFIALGDTGTSAGQAATKLLALGEAADILARKFDQMTPEGRKHLADRLKKAAGDLEGKVDQNQTSPTPGAPAYNPNSKGVNPMDKR